ncbi:MAG: nuclear transport factor 2 family protein, partial [Acidimicrobiales bacterium]
MTPDELVRALYQAYQDRDWGRAVTLLHPDAVVVLPATAERLAGRDAVVEFQRTYPEPWGTMRVERIVAGGESAAAEVTVSDPTDRLFALAAFWSVRDAKLHRGIEYWVEVGGESPPSSRADSEEG